LAKRKKKTEADADGVSSAEQAAESNGSLGSDKIRAALFADRRIANGLGIACRRFKRLKHITPEHVDEFITEVFSLAGEAR
jgi:hypothetical protein